MPLEQRCYTVYRLYKCIDYNMSDIILNILISLFIVIVLFIIVLLKNFLANLDRPQARFQGKEADTGYHDNGARLDIFPLARRWGREKPRLRVASSLRAHWASPCCFRRSRPGYRRCTPRIIFAFHSLLSAPKLQDCKY